MSEKKGRRPEAFEATVLVSGKAVPCTYKVTAPDEVQVGDGAFPAIDVSADGDLEIPNVIEHDGRAYRVTALAPRCFEGCASITSTGLVANSSVTAVGDGCFEGCTESGAEGHPTQLACLRKGAACVPLG